MTGTAPRRRPPNSVSKMMCPESTWCSGPSSFPLSFENCIWKNLPSLRDSNCVVRLDAIEFRWSCMVLFRPTGNPTLPQEITNTFNGPFVSHFDPYANCWLHHLYHICIQLLYPYPPYLFGLLRGEWRSRNATAADSLVAGRRAGTPQRQRLRPLLCPRGAMRWVVGWIRTIPENLVMIVQYCAPIEIWIFNEYNIIQKFFGTGWLFMEHQVSLFESLVCEDASRAKLGCFSSHACQVFDLYRKGTLHCVSWSHHRSWWFALGSQFLEGMLTVDFLKVIVYLFSHGYHLGNLPRLFIFFFGAILRQNHPTKR
jgi:hypothetical protein